MNICSASPGSPQCPRPDFLFAGFNQDCGCFVVGTRSGFKIYNTDPLRQKEDGQMTVTNDPHGADSGSLSETSAADTVSPASPPATGGVSMAEMLFRCPYVAFVALDEPNKVRIWDDAKKKSVVTLDVEAEVRAVRLRRDRVVVVLDCVIKVFSFTSNPSCLLTFPTFSNPRGLCSLSPSSSNSLLAFPAKVKVPGRVQIVDLADSPEKVPTVIDAHETSLSCVMMNVQGTRLATASQKGTLIRVFSTDNGVLLTELRRGSQPATIHSINFSHGTIHIFSLDDSKKSSRQSSLASSATSFLSSNKLLRKYFTAEWSFARIEVPGGAPCICAFGGGDSSIVAVCSDGSYHKFLLDSGGGYTKDVYQMIFEVGAK